MLCVPVVMRAASSAEMEALSSVDGVRLRVSSSRKRLDQVADARVQRNHSPGRHKAMVMVPSVKRKIYGSTKSTEVYMLFFNIIY